MTYTLTQITPPVGNIITTADVKEYISESSDHADGVIDDVVATVTEMLDGEYSRISSSVLPQTWEVAYWDFPPTNQTLLLPLPPVVSVDSVEYDSDKGTVERFTTFRVVNSHGRFFVGSTDGVWPSDGKSEPTSPRVRIQYQAGYTNGTPAGIRQGALALAKHLFDNPDVVERSGTVRNEVIESLFRRFDRK